MNAIRRLVRRLRTAPDPEARALAEQVRYEQETAKTSAFDAPPAMRGFKWPR
jgi:hypothetical protein